MHCFLLPASELLCGCGCGCGFGFAVTVVDAIAANFLAAFLSLRPLPAAFGPLVVAFPTPGYAVPQAPWGVVSYTWLGYV